MNEMQSCGRVLLLLALRPNPIATAAWPDWEVRELLPRAALTMIRGGNDRHTSYHKPDGGHCFVLTLGHDDRSVQACMHRRGQRGLIKGRLIF